MRKIFCFTDSLLEVYRKDYERDTNKFFRASRLGMEHLGTKFQHKGSEYELIGRIDDRDVCCRKDDGTMWALDRITVQRYIIGETNVQFEGNRKLRKIEKDEQ
jgi:hypothetical protein